MWRLFWIIGVGSGLGLAHVTWLREWEWAGVVLSVLLLLFIVGIELVESPGERRDRLAREASWRANEEEARRLEAAELEAKQAGRGLPWAG